MPEDNKMNKDKVYYDESCYVCSLEINTVRERGEAFEKLAENKE